MCALYVRCALSVLQKECRKVWGARYTLGVRYRSENTVYKFSKNDSSFYDNQVFWTMQLIRCTTALWSTLPYCAHFKKCRESTRKETIRYNLAWRTIHMLKEWRCLSLSQLTGSWSVPNISAPLLIWADTFFLELIVFYCLGFAGYVPSIPRKESGPYKYSISYLVLLTSHMMDMYFISHALHKTQFYWRRKITGKTKRAIIWTVFSTLGL